MDHRRLIFAMVALALVLVALALGLLRPPWLAFATQAALTIGSIATIVPAALIGARMLRLLEVDGRPDSTMPPTLRKALETAVVQPRPWHYWALLGGLCLLLAGSVLALAGSWPSATAAA